MYKGQERGKKDLLVLFTILKGKKKQSSNTLKELSSRLQELLT